jgi:hypothetical protein
MHVILKPVVLQAKSNSRLEVDLSDSSRVPVRCFFSYEEAIGVMEKKSDFCDDVATSRLGYCN